MFSEKSRGLLILLCTYVCAMVAGVFSFGLFRDVMPMYAALFAADAVATVLTWLSGVIFRSASVYDPYWSVQTPAIMVSLMVMSCHCTVGGIAFLAFVMLWAVRLTGNFIAGFHGMSYVDWRYRMLREKTGPFFQIVNLLGICMFPTAVVFFASLPAFRYILEGRDFEWLHLVGFAVMLLGTALEFFADIQMKRFIRTRKERGEIIRIGLWKYSRHPNYLGEILFWYGLALVYILPDLDRLPWIAGAVANHIMFLVVSVPMAERNMAKYKPGFAQYKKEVRMFLPFPK